jgi:uncharacterized protein (DUF58 family)
MRRIWYRFFRFLSGVSYWANRRLTAAGALVFSGAVMTAALGVDTRQSAAHQVFGFLAAVLVAALLCLPLLRARVRVERELPRVATAGEPFTYRVRVSNPGATAVDGLSLFEDLADTRPAFETFRAAMRIPNYRAWKRLISNARVARVPEQALPAIEPGATIEIEVQAQALKRGITHSEGVTVARADPLGLLRALTPVPRQANLVVLPRRYALPRFTLPGVRRYQQGGVALATSVGDSSEFIGLREYRPGDSLQRIHWKSYARAAQPIVKEYQDEYFERHALVLDTFSRRGWERRFEAAVSIAASFVYTIETRECLLDLMFIGAEPYVYTAGRGQLQSGSLLEILAAVQPCGDKPLTALAEATLARRHGLSGCICVLLGWDEERRELVQKLRSHGVALRVIVVSEEPVAERPAWLLVIEPDKVQEGLARL